MQFFFKCWFTAVSKCVVNHKCKFSQGLLRICMYHIHLLSVNVRATCS